VASLAARAVLLAITPLRYGAVVFLGPETLLRGGTDRRWLHRVGVRTVTVFLGSDARPPYLDGAFAHGSTPAELETVRRRAALHRDRVLQAERDSTYVVNSPGTGQFQTRPYVDWTALGYPTPELAAAPGAERRHRDRPVLLHAPSDIAMKGTDRIRAAVAALEREGVDVEYVEVSGRPHREVLDAIRASDLVVDQLYSDVLLPGLATEAARLGTPVVVFGYASELLAPLGARAGVPSTQYAHPDELTGVLRRLLGDPRARADIAAVLEQCVGGPWSTEEQARRWASLVSGAPDAAWLNEPDATPYAHGCAIEQSRLIAFLRRYVAAVGPAGLLLDDSPRTKAAVLELAAATSDEGAVGRQ
jgi:hypothetical protein